MSTMVAVIGRLPISQILNPPMPTMIGDHSTRHITKAAAHFVALFAIESVRLWCIAYVPIHISHGTNAIDAFTFQRFAIKGLVSYPFVIRSSLVNGRTNTSAKWVIITICRNHRQNLDDVLQPIQRSSDTLLFWHSSHAWLGRYAVMPACDSCQWCLSSSMLFIHWTVSVMYRSEYSTIYAISLFKSYSHR